MPRGRSTHLFLDLVLASQHSFRLAAQELDAAGDPVRLAGLLAHIAVREPITPGELAGECGVSAGTIRDQIQELVDRGEIARSENEDDGRSYFVTLTPAGRARARLVDGAFRRARRRLARELDVVAAEAVVKEVAAALRRAADAPVVR